jgi:hypothetical protein
MGKWKIGLPVESLKVVRLVKSILSRKLNMFTNENFPLKTNIPTFQYSIIPCMGQKKDASTNLFNLSPA